jgi:AhpD family alkylhydroperoxidase
MGFLEGRTLVHRAGRDRPSPDLRNLFILAYFRTLGENWSTVLVTTTSTLTLRISQLIGGFMEARFNYVKAAPGVFKTMLDQGLYLRDCGLEKSLLNLICLRGSQINGCAYCLDMHWKDLRAGGEDEQRLYSLDAWRECPFYSDRERAALKWTEAVTLITHGHVPDEIYEEVRPYFSEKELSDLTLAVVNINAWNRLNISARTVPGDYQAVNPQPVEKRASMAAGASQGGNERVQGADARIRSKN